MVEISQFMSGPKCPGCGVAQGEYHLPDCVLYRKPETMPRPKLVTSLPEEVQQYRDDIRRFVDAMVYKLRVHHKKGRWEEMPLERALELLRGEVQELDTAVKEGNLLEILTEAADVANYAMIIASIATERGK